MKFNVIIWEPNSKKFVPYNIIPYLVEQYKKAETKPQSFDEFKTFATKESMYQWWSRCEYEIVLQDWPRGDTKKKIDIYQQVMMNIDVVTEILIKEVNGIKS